MAKQPFDRQPGQFRFGFAGAQPPVAQPSRSGAFNGARVQGGDSVAGVERADPITMPSPGQDEIPAFLRAAMEPYIQGKQQEQFVKGFTDAVAGKSLKEVQADDNGIASIFGPSGYHQGAAAFSAKDRYEKFQTDLLANPDQTKTMSTDELGTFLAGKYRDLMTGDPTADHLLQVSIANGHAPLVDTITKQQIAYQQQQATQAWSGSVDSAATSYQALMGQQADLSDPSQSTARQQATNNLLGSLVKPAGMQDETWRKGLASAATNMLAQGNLYAFNALREKGLLKSGGPLDDATIAKLEGDYDRASNKANADAAMAPDVIAATAALHADIASGRVTAPMDAAKRLAKINTVVMQRTGSDVPLYDTSAVVSSANAVTDAAVAADRRRQERQWQLEDRQATWDHEAQVKAQDRAETSAQVTAAFGTGDVAFSIAKGLGQSSDYDSFAASAYARGDMGSLAKAYIGTSNGSGYVSGAVARSVQSSVAAFGPKYTKDFDGAYQKWKALDGTSPGAAAAYYGPQNIRMKAYDSLVGTGASPVVAYGNVFGEDKRFDTAGLDPAERKELRSAVDDAVGAMSRSNLRPWTWNKYDLPESTNAVISSVIGNEAVAYLAHSGVSPEAAVGIVAPKARAAGHFELVGRFAWTNARGTKPLTQVLHAQQGDLDKAFMGIVDDRLKAAGFSKGAYGDDYTVRRYGNDGIYVMGSSPDGSDTKEIVVTLPEIKARLDGQAGDAVKSANAGVHTFTAKGNPLGADWQMTKDTAEAYARGLIPDYQKRQQIKTIHGRDYPWAPGIGALGEPLPKNWRGLPVKDNRYLLLK